MQVVRVSALSCASAAGIHDAGAFQVFEEGRTLASTKVKDTYEDDYDLGD